MTKRKKPIRRGKVAAVELSQRDLEELALRFLRSGGRIGLEEWSRLGAQDQTAFEVAQAQIEFERAVAVARLMRGGHDAEIQMMAGMSAAAEALRAKHSR